MEKNNKIALVTGGSRGLGRNMALSLASAGLDIVITYHSRQDQAEEVVREIEALGRKAHVLQLDVEKAQGYGTFAGNLKQALKEIFQREDFDFLVNNAGIGIHAPFEQTSMEQFDQLVNIHLKSAYFLTQTLLPVLADGGGIVNVSTGLARFSLPGYSAYAAMKGAIETLTRYQAKELGARGIRVNVVAPGAIETDFGGGVVRDNAEMNRMIASQTALGRVGLPADIGPVVAFLCSDAAGWVNGQRIEVSGGIYL